MMNHWQGWLYVAAVLVPLAAFTVELLGGRLLKRLNAYIATGAIGFSCVLSLIGLVLFLPHFSHSEAPAPAPAAEHAAADSEQNESHDHNAPRTPFAWTGGFNWVLLGAGLQTGSDGRLNQASPGLAVPLAIHIDGLAVIMFAMVTFIATLIHIYSMGYMSEDPRYPRFFTYLSLFCFSMLALVASANVFMIFMSWELVGVCSYLLIGFWYEDKKNADAANKAFVVNRVGDIGMIIGIGLLWTSLGTFNFSDLNRALADPALRDDHGRITRATASHQVTLHIQETSYDGTEKPATTKSMPYWVLVLAGLGIFAGCVGKSAQFPLHVWLPDAMAGPTPVSALIHAATMVAAGVYLVGRFFPLFTDEVLLYVAYTGGITAVIGATIAMVQTDYKKVLAYSTVSQLGFMMLALGVGGWSAGLFHLLTHAFFKALLFLGAGSIYHAVHTYEMPLLGGLKAKMPTTRWTVLVATLAISGVPGLSGFYSKDAILAAALQLSSIRPEHALLFIMPAAAAALTAFYMFRFYFLVFEGTPRGEPAPAHDHGHGHGHGHDDHAHAAHDAHHGRPFDHAHESPPIMIWPLRILAVFAIFVGWPKFILPIVGGEPVLEGLLSSASVLPVHAHANWIHWVGLASSLLIASVGIGLAALFYHESWKRFEAASVVRLFSAVHEFFQRKWYFDEIYNATLVQPTLRVARVCSGFDKRVIDGVVDGSAQTTVGVSKFEGFFDNFAVDGLVNLTAWVIYGLGDWGRWLQSGRLRHYLAVLAVAVVGLFAGVFYWVR